MKQLAADRAVRPDETHNPRCLMCNFSFDGVFILREELCDAAAAAHLRAVARTAHGEETILGSFSLERAGHVAEPLA